MWPIIKKEVKSYFLSPIGYIFIGLFLAICSVFFYMYVVTYASLNFEYIFYSAASLLMFITPILTMRMFAEERKNGTEQLLLTSPRSVTSIVLGKFLSAVIILLITVLLTFLYFIILMFFGKPDITTALVSMLGFVLIGMAYIAFGMFASSITENQIIAAVITIGFFILIDILPGMASQSSILSILSLSNMFNKFPSGLIPLDSVIAYGSFTLLFILLTIIVLQRKKSVK